MKTCTFFGHRDCTDSIAKSLDSEIEKLIHIGVREFYVGNNGGFDRQVYTALTRAKNIFPDINVYVVLSHIDRNPDNYENTVIPDGFEMCRKDLQ